MKIKATKNMIPCQPHMLHTMVDCCKKVLWMNDFLQNLDMK
jgi:hypothetical protein